MWIKRQEGYCLKKIAGVQYLLPYGQKVADQKKGIVLNDTGVFLWNELDEPMTQSVLAERLVEQYAQDNEEKLNDEIRDEIRQDVKQFVQELIALEILQECPEFERDENGCYPTNQVLAGYLKIAEMIIYLYGDRELISSQFDPFFSIQFLINPVKIKIVSRMCSNLTCKSSCFRVYRMSIQMDRH